MQKRRILLIAPTTTYRLDDFLTAAQRLDVEVLLATNRCGVLARLWPEHATLSLPFSAPRQAVSKAAALLEQTPVDAVLAVDDESTPLASMLARKLKLPGNTPKSTKLARNKYLFRKALSASELPSPDFQLFAVEQDFRKKIEWKKLPFPCVLKPLTLSGSQGVIRADNRSEFSAAFRRIAAILEQTQLRKTKDKFAKFILAEQFIEGDEFAIEGLLTDGRLRILTIFDKPDPLNGPYFEETIYLTPSGLPPELQVQIHRTLEAACHLLGLRHGPLHAEVRINAHGIFLIEIAPRTIGGLCSRIIKFAAHTPLEELVIRHALGENIDNLFVPFRAAGVMMIPIPRHGILHEVHGLQKARMTPGVSEVQMTIEPGNMIVPLPEGNSYLGFIFATGHSTASVEHSLRAAAAVLDFRIKPALGTIPSA